MKQFLLYFDIKNKMKSTTKYRNTFCFLQMLMGLFFLSQMIQGNLIPCQF